MQALSKKKNKDKTAKIVIATEQFNCMLMQYLDFGRVRTEMSDGVFTIQMLCIVKNIFQILAIESSVILVRQLRPK